MHLFRTITLACLLAEPCLGQVGGDKELVLTISGTTTDESVGSDLDSAGDYNGDGFDDLLVGCSNDIARIYSGFDGSILREYSYGETVANLGDLDQDGFDDYAFGSVAVPGAWVKVVTVVSGQSDMVLFTVDGPWSASFGECLAAAGDLDGDGTPDLLIGDPSSATNESGTVFAHSGATGAELYTLSGWDWWEQFGDDISSLGDIDGDGVPDFIVQAAGDFWAASLPATYVFSGLGNQIAWHYDQYYGKAVGDVNGDGIGDYSHTDAWPINYSVVRSGADHSEIYQFGGYGGVVGFGDLDGDGRAEVGNKLNLAIRLHSGISGVGQSVFTASPDGTQAISCNARNLRGDGMPHIATGDPTYSSAISNIGRVLVYRFHPLLSLNAPSLTASGSQTVEANLSFPSSEAGELYCVLVSATGVGPIQVGPVFIPVTDDSLFYAALRGFADNVFVFDRIGFLDGNGDATASMISHPALSVFAGMDLYFAAVTFGTGRVRMSSAVTRLEILP